MERFGPWNLQRRLGAGGMAEAFLARRADGTGGPVCVKRTLPGLKGTPGFAAMFRDEIAVTRSLRHEHIVAVHDSGDEEGVLWLAMEYVDGPSLAAVLARAVREGIRPTIGQALEIGRQLALALDAAHTAKGPDGQPLGLVHRDVSPQNILFSRFGILKLSDFGIARAEERLARTATGVMKGKLGYLAPEQITGDVVDHRADQFAAGIVLWETLCTRRLFRGPELEVLEAVVGSDVAAPSRYRDDVPPVVDALVARMLQREPGARFPTMAAVAQAIDGLLVGETSSNRALAPLVMIDDESSTMRIPRTRFTIEDTARGRPVPSADTGVWSPPAAVGFEDATAEGDIIDEEPTSPAPRQERPSANTSGSPFDEASGLGARPWPIAARVVPATVPMPSPAPAPSVSSSIPSPTRPSSPSPSPSPQLRLEALPQGPSRAAVLGVVALAAVLTGAIGVGVGVQIGRGTAPSSAVAGPPAVAPPAGPPSPPTPLPTTLPSPPPSPPPPPLLETDPVVDTRATAAAWDALRATGRGVPCVAHLTSLSASLPRSTFLERAGTLIEACAALVDDAPTTARGRDGADIRRLADDAKILMVRGEYGGAVVLLKRILLVAPGDARTHLQLGICYAQLRKNTVAREHYRRFLELQPEGPDADRVRKSLESL